ncbi:MAG: hypothetical protein A2Z64_15400 [Betaproteobacteria bacterium RIFCSPLOWO2_02_67_12]|nr:MAG: hypothetical protein A2Z64_15400 [Betaproteobacteria bacterium RIFCSPLOWO2_02_67_12]OGA29017.1 MAG: hypothetical protein A3I65_03485 [Betaproteobacteria bacterium RIFCSPLOWO2_02_FULL_68_150]OGA73170.1 MAG: hypothetical protein A3F77_02740 [Betaproteobacteria bacterium RIFCSPLOWO2_12_FULL_67_28]
MRRLLRALVVVQLAGCASLEVPLRDHLGSQDAPLRDCASWFVALDDRVEAAGVRDAQETRVAGFPYLRVNRLLAALAPAAASDPGAMQALVERLARLDQAARRAELANLPGQTSGAAQRRTDECARLLRAADLAQPESLRRLLGRLRVPDDYSTTQRLLGLYALTRIPFAAGVRRWEAEVRTAFRRDSQEVPAAARVRYEPPALPAQAGAAALRALATADANALRLPEPSAGDLELLLAAHAPILEIEQSGDHDRFGKLRWLPETEVPSVDASDPVVYVDLAHTVYRGRPLLQLVYTIWFAERPAEGRGDLFAGALDGLVWRVTLAPDGEPLLYDSIHACGCFHLFFPTPRARLLAAPDGLDEWALVPQTLARIPPDARPVVRLAARTHYVERVWFTTAAGSAARYTFHRYEELRSLARVEGGRRSAFGPDALIAGSERAERHLFWPMGIASAGAMRQWGRHATAFVGRRHFDDADLLEKRFVFDLK